MPKRPTKDERDATELARQELEQFKDLILHNKDINVHHFLNKGEYSKTHKSKSKQKSLDMLPELTDIESISRFLMNPADETAVMQEQALMIATLQKNKNLKSIPRPEEIWYNIRINILEKELELRFGKQFSFFWDEPEELTEEERSEATKILRGLDEGRTLLFERSNYGKMYRELQKMPSKLAQRVEMLSEKDPNAIAGLEHTEHQALAYYFAMHTELDPIAAYNLTQTQHDEIIDLYSRLDAYMAQRIKSVSNLGAIEIAFFAFINKNDRELRKKQGLPAFNPILIKNYVMPNTKIVNMLDNILTPEAQEQGSNTQKHEAEIALHEDKKNKPVTTYILAQADDINLPSTFTPYDREVYNAVCSIWEADPDKVLTPQTVYRTMTRKKKGEFVAEPQINEIDKSIEKMRHIQVTIDATREAKAYGYTAGGKPIDSFKLNDYLLSLRKVEVNAGGNIVTAYKIHAEPLLLQYSKFSNQIVTIPANLLEIKTTSKKKEAAKITKSSITLLPDAAPIANSEKRIVIKGYLLRTIATIQNTKTNRSPKILIDTLLEACNLDTKKKARYVDYIRQCLDYWTAAEHIKGYSIEKQGKGVRAFIIDP